jgi:hypothetical protein
LFLQGSLDLVGLVAGDALLDGLRGSVDEVLRLLEAQAGQLPDDLDDGDLVRADLGQRRRELALLLGAAAGAAPSPPAAGRAAATATGAAAVTP